MLNGLDIVAPWILVAILFFPLRWLERWLHQHIFKVGWLLTKNFQTTTILYYTFFLPGVVLHEIIYWLVAGILNVRADRAIVWPEAQAIGELKLTFIRLSKAAGALKVAIISTAPLITGIVAVLLIANNVLNVGAFFTTLSSGTIASFTGAISQLTSAPDFWLWVYIAFTISNTMMPDPKSLRGWGRVGIIIAVMLAVLFLLGLGTEVLDTLGPPLINAASILAGAFAVMIGINLVMLAILGSVESIIERITGDSATIQNGKLVGMRRSEILKMRAEQAAKQAKQAPRKPAAPSGPPSIYKIALPIPPAPGKEPTEEKPAQQIVQPPTITAGRAGPAMITGTVVSKPESKGEEPATKTANPSGEPPSPAQ